MTPIALMLYILAAGAGLFGCGILGLIWFWLLNLVKGFLTHESD